MASMWTKWTKWIMKSDEIRNFKILTNLPPDGISCTKTKPFLPAQSFIYFGAKMFGGWKSFDFFVGTKDMKEMYIGQFAFEIGLLFCFRPIKQENCFRKFFSFFSNSNNFSSTTSVNVAIKLIHLLIELNGCLVFIKRMRKTSQIEISKVKIKTQFFFNFLF